MHGFHTKFKCCLDPHFSLKVKGLHGDAEALLQDEAFFKGLRLCVWATKVCNMHVERLLSLLRHACGLDRAPEAERFVVTGFLQMLLT